MTIDENGTDDYNSSEVYNYDIMMQCLDMK